MHILIIPSERYVPPESPLAGIFQQRQAQALARVGFKVGILSPDLYSLRLLRRGLAARPTGIQITDDGGIPVFKYYGWNWLPRVPGGHTTLWLRAGTTLFRSYAVQQGIPDIIHAHNARCAGILACKIKEVWHVPYVLTEHSSAYALGQVPAAEMSHIREAYKNANRRLVVSPSLGNLLEQAIGDVVCPWEWLPNILDAKFEQHTPANSDRRAQRSFRFLNVGSLIEIKGQSDLLRAFASQFAGKRGIELHIGGGGPLKKDLEALATELGIGRQVTFLGELHHEQVLAEMQACDAYVHSSHYETFGVVLIEALSCGKPVVATACGGPQCIVNTSNGLLAPPRDPAGLGQAMAAVRENISRYHAARIRQDCIARFGAQAVVSQLATL